MEFYYLVNIYLPAVFCQYTRFMYSGYLCLFNLIIIKPFFVKENAECLVTLQQSCKLCVDIFLHGRRWGMFYEILNNSNKNSEKDELYECSNELTRKNRRRVVSTVYWVYIHIFMSVYIFYYLRNH